MKDWFPFTDYDFYGYLSSGLVFLAALDYWMSGGQLLQQESWSFIQGAVIIAVAYISGQIISIPASVVLETFVARTLLRPPTVLLLRDKANWFEWFLSRFFIGRYYAPLPTSTRDKIFIRAAKDTGLARDKLHALPEDVFAPAFSYARKIEDTRKRIDDFRNQYGFNRNMAMTGFIAALLMFDRFQRVDDDKAVVWMVLALLLSFGMLIRFLKFYSSFSAEIFRAYAFQEQKP